LLSAQPDHAAVCAHSSNERFRLSGASIQLRPLLRSTVSSRTSSAGKPSRYVKQVQERLGHSSPMVTLETYAHLWPGEDDRTRDVMDAALTPLADSLRTRGA